MAEKIFPSAGRNYVGRIVEVPLGAPFSLPKKSTYTRVYMVVFFLPKYITNWFGSKKLGYIKNRSLYQNGLLVQPSSHLFT